MVGARAEELIRGIVESEGLELVHVTYLDKGAASVLRIYIDKSSGVNLADCQKISRHVGVLLDVEDLIPHRYTLEVSSPGIERPLFSAADFERFAGREVRVVSREKVNDRRNFMGILVGLSEDGIVEIDCGGERVQLPYDQIKKANLVYRFDR